MAQVNIAQRLKNLKWPNLELYSTEDYPISFEEFMANSDGLVTLKPRILPIDPFEAFSPLESKLIYSSPKKDHHGLVFMRSLQFRRALYNFEFFESKDEWRRIYSNLLAFAEHEKSRIEREYARPAAIR